MYYLATDRGFYRRHSEFSPFTRDLRRATPFVSFDDADAAGKELFPEIRYYGILVTAVE